MVTMSWYLVKIVETHMEITKDGYYLGYLSFSFAAILDFGERKNGIQFFLIRHVLKI